MAQLSMREISLTQGQVALVDDEDYEMLSVYSWFAFMTKSGFYAATGRGTEQRLMHRMIMGDPEGFEIDHRNGNGLENIRTNLRVATHQQNMRNRKMQCNNTSGFRGVSRSYEKWGAAIKVDGKRQHLGTFSDPIEAARAYDVASLRYHGEFGRLNFPLERIG